MGLVRKALVEVFPVEDSLLMFSCQKKFHMCRWKNSFFRLKAHKELLIELVPKKYIHGAMAAQTLGEMTWVQRLDEIGARLDDVDQNIKGQNEWHAEVDRSIKDLTCSLDRLTATMQNALENKVQAQFSRRKKVASVASVVSMVAMESTVLEDLMAEHLPVRPTRSEGDSFEPISSSRSMQSLVPKPPSGEMMPEVPGVLENESKAVGQMQESTAGDDKSKQGNHPEHLQSFTVTEDDQVHKKQNRTVTCSTAKLNRESQVNILGSMSENGNASFDSGSKFIMALPACIYLALGA